MRFFALLAFTACASDRGHNTPMDASVDAPNCKYVEAAFSGARYVLIQPLADVEPAMATSGTELWLSRLDEGSLSRVLRQATRSPPSERFFQNAPPAFVDDSADEHSACLTADGLRLLFVSSRGATEHRVYETSRSSSSEPFGSPVLRDEIPGEVESIDVSLDGLTIYISRVPGDVTSASRSSLELPFGAETLIAGRAGYQIAVSPDERELFFAKEGQQIHRRVRPTTQETFDCEQLVLTDATEPDVSPNGLELVFSRRGEIAIATRSTLPEM